MLNRVNDRRHFLRSLALGASCLLRDGATLHAAAAPVAEGVTGRDFWVVTLLRVAEPVLKSLANGTLRAAMPVECPTGKLASRKAVTHLEAVGRTLAGIAPWLASTGGTAEESAQRERLREDTRRGLAGMVDEQSPDHLDFTAAQQNLVDAAFLALGLSRARSVLWAPLDPQVRRRLIEALRSTRKFTPPENNWLLFAAMIEAFLGSEGEDWNPAAIDKALTSHEHWYKGDGAYGDGPEFHWDYYNSYVIHPMLLQVLDLIAPVDARWEPMRPGIKARARRYAAVQERFIAPDGSYPVLGRSITYRCGAFHHLADMALRRELPEGLEPAQVRCALESVIRRTLLPEGTFDAQGWLQVGLAGHQPRLAEAYISTGSLYLCSCAFLPLGLPPEDPFWNSPDVPWTARRAWSGADLAADHALSEVVRK